jgi:membrane-associated phospholipid phosphatase
MEPFVLPFETLSSEIVPLSLSFDTLSQRAGMTEAKSMAFATQINVPELELLNQEVEYSLSEGFDPLTGISLSQADSTDISLLIPEQESLTTVPDSPLDVILEGGQNRQQRERIPPVIVAHLRDETDSVTNNPIIEGTVTDDSRISQFMARFERTPARPYYNLFRTLNANGNFSLDANVLRRLNRNRTLTEGQHTLQLRALDQWNNLAQVNLTFTVDLTQPRLIANLLEDTGSSNSDRITNNAAISGRIEDLNAIASLKAGFDATPVSNFVDITQQLNSDKTFILDNLVLKQINSNLDLSQGQHTLKLIATDQAGNTSSLFSYTFTLDTIAPTPPNLALDPTFDVAPLGDAQTTFSRVGLYGQTENNIKVTLVGGGETTASAFGQFSFSDVALALGDNPFTIKARDSAGNESQFSTTIERVTDTNSDVVIDWNATLLKAIQVERTSPPSASRHMAMVHAAIYDAVNGIIGTYNPYLVNQTAPVGASPEAAVAAAAHRVLVNLYPNQQAIFDAALTDSLANITDGPAKDTGIAYGQQVASAILEERSTDGSNQTANYTPGTDLGDWQPTPPPVAPPLSPHWGSVTPFTMSSGSQFRPDGPPALNSQEYANDYNQVKELGKSDSSTRTADQTEIALFWADGSGTFTPPGDWNQIAEQLSAVPGRSLIENARLFALLNIGLADAGIACWDSKYTYNFWRPVTAIRSGDNDNNPQTFGDPNWTPLLATPPFPEYMSGHSTFSGTGSTILAGLLGNNISFSTSSLGFPGIQRSFESFDAAASEAGISRIYGGIHFLSANEDGLATGRALGTYVLENFLKQKDELLTVMPGQTLEISLDEMIPNSSNATFSLSSEGQLPTGMLLGDGTLTFNPTADEVGTYPFTVIASQDGQQSEHEFTLQVIADPVTTTRISGVIENTDQQPLFGVIIELGNLQTTTDAAGAFTLETPGELPSDTLKVRGEAITGKVTYPFIAEKLPLLFGRDPIVGVNNVISRPIYLPPIDTAHAVTIDPTVDTTVTNEAIAGASVFVEAGSLLNQQGELYTGQMSITTVPRELTPAALPPNLLPDLVVTIQPGEMVFTTPAPLSLPNLAGYEPGTIMDLWSINPITGLFDNVGTGEVSADGSVVETISGGIHNSSWHFFTPPPPSPPDNLKDNDYNEDKGCEDCQTPVPGNSEVELHSGAVIETHDLASYPEVLN